MKMPWGAFKGKELEEVPSGYLRWLAENCKDEKICAAADTEWQWRNKFDLHF